MNIETFYKANHHWVSPCYWTPEVGVDVLAFIAPSEDDDVPYYAVCWVDEDDEGNKYWVNGQDNLAYVNVVAWTLLPAVPYDMIKNHEQEEAMKRLRRENFALQNKGRGGIEF